MVNHTYFKAVEDGLISWSGHKMRCSLGKAGIVAADLKREGDNKSPLGDWPIRRVFYRADRITRPTTLLPVFEITSQMGWSDDPADPDNYNTLITLPYIFSHEKLYREDHVYDIVVELGYNDDPPVPGHGSAIFMHIKRGDYEGTEGCVALAYKDLIELLRQAKPGDFVSICTKDQV